MEMRNKDGFWYALEPFSTYKYRAKFLVQDLRGNDICNTDIYSTNESEENLENILRESVFKKFDKKDISIAKIVHWSSKKQDDLTAELIEELFNF